MSQPSDRRQGRWIRAALVLFPFGTILLGIASFGIWQWKKDQAEIQNLQYANAMRQSPQPQAWQRYMDVLTEVSQRTPLDRLAATAAYIESSVGAENMGYTPKRIITRLDPASQPVEGIQLELTGRRMPRDVTLLVFSYGSTQPADIRRENAAIASILSLAHWITGEPTQRTLRIMTLPLSERPTDETGEILTRLAEDIRLKSERVTHLILDPVTASHLQEPFMEALQIAARGTVNITWQPPQSPPPAENPEASLSQIRQTLLELAISN